MSKEHAAILRQAFEVVAFEVAEEANLPTSSMAALSQAISLKRIADALWGTPHTTGIVQLLNGIEAKK